MNSFLVVMYFVCFAIVAGGAFALMWQNLSTLEWKKPPVRHPEAPQPGEEVMYVDLQREKLEALYTDD